MDFGVASSFLAEARIALEQGELSMARTLVASAGGPQEDPIYEGWNYEEPPLNEGILDKLTKSRLVHGLAKKAGIHTNTNVRDDLKKIHDAGQNAIAMSDRAHKYNKGAGSKNPMDHPDTDVSMAQHHSAIKAHQAVLSRLDKAGKAAAAAKDHDAMAWIQHAKDIHNQHRNWNMKMARNQRFNGSLAHQAGNQQRDAELAQAQHKYNLRQIRKTGKLPGQDQASAAPEPAKQAPQASAPQQTAPAQAPAAQAKPNPAAASPFAGRGTVNPQTGKRIGAFDPKTGQRMNAPMSPGAAAMAGAGIGQQPMQQQPMAQPQPQPQQPQMQAPQQKPAVQRVKRRKAKAPPMAAAEGIELSYESILESLK